MHNAAIAALGLDAAYVAFRVPAAGLAAALGGLAALGGAGANVTLPHKEAAAVLCDELSPEARAAGAVNTIVFGDGRIAGHLTDGLGMLDALRDARRRAGRPTRARARRRRLGTRGRGRAARRRRGPVRVLARRSAAGEELAGALAGLGRVEVIDTPPPGPLGIVAHCTPGRGAHGA